VGRAFDYLLRFELQRRAPHAQTRPWAAESALWLIEHGVDVLSGADPAQYLPPQLLAEQFREILSQAKSAVASYVSSKRQTRSDQEELAIHAIHLAHMEEVYRRTRLYPNFQEVNDEDVQDLLELLAIVPFDALIDPKLLILNNVRIRYDSPCPLPCKQRCVREQTGKAPG
jgi:hypothetical protein